ncbi:MAG: tetratricopeptide repeat protein, partial [Anaerolineales bacterium]|nr:tetratricopeptide repeat protein [Anaerolineales bacterium]
YHDVDYRLGLAAALGNLAIVYHRMGNLETAVEYGQQALEHERAIGHVRGEAEGLSMMGMLYQDLGDLSQAIAFHQAALDMSQKAGYRLGMALDMSNLGAVLRKSGEFQRALDMQNQALATITPLHNPDLQGVILYGRAATHEALGHLHQARADYEAALAHVEWLRGTLAEESHRISMLDADRLGIYRRLARLYHRSFQDTLATFELVERARTRVLLEQLGTATLHPPAGASASDLLRESKLLARLQELHVALRQEEMQLEKRAALVGALAKVRAGLNELWNGLAEDAPDYVVLRRGDPTTYAQIRTLLRPLLSEQPLGIIVE